jgi:hypothetical protein
MKNSKNFRKFDKKLSQYPNLYTNPSINTKYIKFERKTNGIFLKEDKLIKKIYYGLMRRK